MKTSNKGSISVFIILILISVIMFEFVLFDVGQSMMLNHQLDQLSESTLRSIHSEYNKALAEYGIFGIVNLNEKKNILDNQLKSNNINNSSQIFSTITNINIDKFTSTSKLNDLNVLQTQILKEMKWRAPLEWSFIALDKMKQSNIRENVDQSSKIAEMSKDIENKFIAYHKSFVELDNLMNSIMGNTGEILIFCKDSKISLNQLQNETNYVTFLEKWNIYVVELKLKQSSLFQTIEPLLGKLEELRSIHSDLINELKNRNVLDNTSKIFISDGYFNQLKLQTKEIQSIINGMSKLINSTEHLVGYDFSNRNQELLASIGELQRAVALIFGIHSSEFKRVNDGLNQRLSSQNESKNNISKSISELKDILHSCPNRGVQVSTNPPKLTPNEIGIESLKKTGKILKGFETFTNHFYISEYVINKFNYRTFKNSSENSFNHAHVLYNYEVEKMIFEQDSCEANQSFATIEIFLSRLAIRITEELLSGAFNLAISPWTGFIEIVAKSSYLALDDTKKLVRGEDVIFSVKSHSTFKLNYLDYIRFYLYAQKNTKELLVNIQEIIELNTDVPFREVTTAARLVVKMNRSRHTMISKWGNNRGVAEAIFSY